MPETGNLANYNRASDIMYLCGEPKTATSKPAESLTRSPCNIYSCYRFCFSREPSRTDHGEENSFLQGKVEAQSVPVYGLSAAKCLKVFY